MRRTGLMLVFTMLIAGPRAPALAATNLVQNSNFALTSYTSNNQFGTVWTQSVMQGVTDWIGNGGYNIFFFNGTATTTSANTQYSGQGNTQQKLYATSQFTGSSPTNQNFVAFDADPNVGGGGGISQSIAGLTPGTDYSVSFTWAGAQLQSETGATTEKLQVSLGTQTITTNTVSNASQGFTGWVTQSYTFVANATTEVLSFLAVGTPSGLPPVVALSNVSLVAVPEPGTMAVFAVGLAGLARVRRRRAAGRANNH